jgi:hypothetical protein
MIRFAIADLADRPERFGDYVAQAPMPDLAGALASQRPITPLLPELDLRRAYAPGKWSAASVLLHLADTERVFAYRALRIARGDTTPMPGFDQDLFAANDDTGGRDLASLGAELDAVRKQAGRLQKEGDTVRAQATAYCTARQSDIATISNVEMRQAAVQRTRQVKEKCDDIKDRYAAVNVSFSRYIRTLADLQTYLGTQLNFSTLDSGQKWIDEALASGEMLRGDIRSLALEMELTSNIISPIPVAVTQWPTDLQPPDAMAQGH